MNEYYEYFGPTYHLDVPQSNAEDMNTREYLEKIKAQVFENLRHTGSAPSVQMTGELRSLSAAQLMVRSVTKRLTNRVVTPSAIPRTAMDEDDDLDEDERDPNQRRASEFELLWSSSLINSALMSRFSSPPPLSSPLFAMCPTPFIHPPSSLPAQTLDSRIQRDDEFSDSEDEGTGGRRDRTSHRENGFSKSKKASKTTTNTLLTSDLIPPSTRPPVPIPETIPGVPEGEDVEIEMYEGPPATTSAARATTTAGEGEDDARGAGDVEMAESEVQIPAEGVPAPKGDTPIPF